MKKNISIVLFLIASLMVTFSAESQIINKKPKIKVDKSKVNIGKDKSGSGDSGTSIVPKSDPSGLFHRISDDRSASSHRATAVEKLEKLEAEYAKEIVDYSKAEGLIEQIDKRLEMVLKLEPNIDKDKFDERYNAVKNPIQEDLEAITPMKEMSKTLRTKFKADDEYQKIDVLGYRKITGYRDAAECYCREHDQTGTYSEYEKLKQEYKELGEKVSKYKDEAAKKSIEKMEKCLENGIKYVDFVATEGYKTDIIDFSVQEKPSNPNAVISKCEKYLVALDLIKTDPSLNLPEASIKKLDNAKDEVSRIKTEAEVYISSGEFEKHKAAIRAERAKLVEMPKPVTKSATLESQAMSYIKGQGFKSYLSATFGDARKGYVVSTLRAVSLHSQCVVKKNSLDVPKYQYKEIVVAYKDTDGLCQMVSVYATSPTWSADAPIQIACENVNK